MSDTNSWWNELGEFFKKNWPVIVGGGTALAAIIWLLRKAGAPEEEIRVMERVKNGELKDRADEIYKEVTYELDELIGLENVKKQIRNIVNYLIVSKMREESGLRSDEVGLHMVFYGAPGTGKTTVARILGKIYKKLGFLDRGHVVEVDKGGLEGMYVGHTAGKTREMVDRASGGILFIDEAYALYEPDRRGFGHEAIATLLKEMEDRRGEFIVIMAGYKDEMEDLVNSNPGLKSRFQRHIEFPDYSNEELFEIFRFFSEKNEYRLNEGIEVLARALLFRCFDEKKKIDGRSFGNARFVRNLFDRVKEAQAERVVREGGELEVITLGDMEKGVEEEGCQKSGE